MNPNTTYDVTSSFVQTVDGDRGSAAAVLCRIDPMRSLADRLSALGLDDRAIWSDSGDLAYTLVWRFPPMGTPGSDWRIEVSSDGNGRTMLTLKIAGRGRDAAARARLLAAWTLLEELARAHTRRLARTLDDYANADDYGVAPPRLRAVV